MEILNTSKDYIPVVQVDNGECFILEGFTYIKTDRADKCACTVDVVKLFNGAKETLPYECRVRVVEVTAIIGETPRTLQEKGLI